jgi:hypothetical protein
MWVKKTFYSMFGYLLLAFMSSAFATGGDLKIAIDDDTAYRIHYNAFESEMLTPETARSYDIVRSKNRMVLTVSIRKGGKDALLKTTAVEAKVTAEAKNLTGQINTLEMKKVIEGDAIYYVSYFKVSNKETLRFTIQVDPEMQGREHEIKFEQQFFVD